MGYEPQETGGPEAKRKFWNYLDKEVEEASKNENMLVIQMDSNAWLGDEIIKGDPNPTNNNGKLFINFLERNQHIKIVNSLSICQGLITHQ